MVKIGKFILRFFDKIFKTKNVDNRTLKYNKSQDRYNTNQKQWNETKIEDFKSRDQLLNDPKKFSWLFEPEFDNIIADFHYVEHIYDAPSNYPIYENVSSFMRENPNGFFKGAEQESEEHIYEEIPEIEYMNINNDYISFEKENGRETSSGYYTPTEEDNSSKNYDTASESGNMPENIILDPEADNFSEDEFSDSFDEDSMDEGYYETILDFEPIYDHLNHDVKFYNNNRISKNIYDPVAEDENIYDPVAEDETPNSKNYHSQIIYENITEIIEDPESENFDKQETEDLPPLVELYEDQDEISVFNNPNDNDEISEVNEEDYLKSNFKDTKYDSPSKSATIPEEDEEEVNNQNNN